MQVKVCPKCKSENKVDNLSCSSCYASLDGVAPSESTKEPRAMPPAQPKAPAATAPRPAGPAPVGAAAPPPGSPQNPYGPPPGTGGPMFRERPPQPIKSGPNVGLIVFIILLLAGGAFAGWWFFLKGPTPEQLVKTFITAATANDTETIKKCLTKANLSDPQISAGLSRGINMGAPPSGKTDKPSVLVKSTTFEGSDRALVKIEPTDKTQIPKDMDVTFDVVVVKEDGKWKIDIKQTEEGIRVKMRSLMAEMMKRQFGGAPGGMPGK